MRRDLFYVAALALAMQLGSCVNTPQFGKSPVEKVVRAMTIEEKANLLMGETEGLVQTYAIPRLGIPSVSMVSMVSTGIPVNDRLLSQTWNPELVQEMGTDVACEVLSKGYDCILLPSFSSSEMPFLSGMLTASFASGIRNAGTGTALALDAGLENTGMDIVAKEQQHWAVVVNDTIVPSEWEFEGVVVSLCSSSDEDLQPGIDILIPGMQPARDRLIMSLEKGTVSVSEVNKRIIRILAMVEKSIQKPVVQDYHANTVLYNTVESEGMVLLKNDGVLPLSPDVRKVALYGVSSYNTVMKGGTDGISIEKGLESLGYKIDPAVASQYRQYASSNSGHVQPESLARQPFRYRADAIVDDVAIITIGRDNADLNLVSSEQELLKDVCESFHAKGKKVVLVLNTLAPVRSGNWTAYPDAILLAGIPGTDAGTIITAILSGRVNPSGKLIDADTSFPFGFGLSYTSFQYSNASAVHENGKITMSVTVTNTGKALGKDIVQVYVEPSSKGRPAQHRELRTFAKTKLLQPGESQTLSFDLYDYYLPSATGELTIYFSACSDDLSCSVPVTL